MRPGIFFVRLAAAAVVCACGASQALAGFEWTPPSKPSAAAVAVPEVEAEPLAPIDMVPAKSNIKPKIDGIVPAQPLESPGQKKLLHAAPSSAEFSAPEMAAPEQAPKSVLKMKKIGPEDMPAISKPPAGMRMPENPVAVTGPQSAKSRTVSVPPSMKEEPLPPLAPTITAFEKAQEPERRQLTEEQKRLSINPFPAAQTSSRYEEVVGFGSDMPLALALRQITPPQYAFSFAKGVNPGYRVSWNGGAPWNDVVQNMIAPLNLVYEIRGNTLIIKPSPAVAKDGEISSSYAPMAPAVKPLPKNEATAEAPPAALAPIPPAHDVGTAASTEGATEDTATNRKLLTQNKFDSANQGIDHTRIWEAAQGDNLKDTLARWSRQAGVNLVWNSAHDYALDSGVMVNGTFGSALTVLFMHGLEPGTAPRHRFSVENGVSRLIVEDPVI